MEQVLNICDKFISSNFDERPQKIIDTIVIHSTHMTFIDSITKLCDKSSKVSCHYLINLNGDIYQLISDQARAWHAGISYWRGKTSLNDNSIGIELVDTNNKKARIKKFPKSQMISLIELLKLLLKKYNIPNHNIIAHSDIAPDRKDDPGEYFNWRLLASHNIGNYHNIKPSKEMEFCFMDAQTSSSEVKKIQKMLQDYGYKININGKLDTQTQEVIIAFKRHFNPSSLKNNYFSIADFKILLYLSKLK